LQQIQSPLIKEVRGRGLMIGLELFPRAGGARTYCERLMSLGVLCKETHDTIIRFTPPLDHKERGDRLGDGENHLRIRQRLNHFPT
jgi:acetylornithine/succinyldiaminopimelate/putrescine aminotransferase